MARDTAAAANPTHAPRDLALAPEVGTGWRKRVMHHRTALVVVAGLLLVYLAGFNAEWRLSPDSAANANLARHLLHGGSFADAAEHGIHATKLQPGLPWLMAGSMHLFGENTLWPLTFVIWTMALGGLVILYRLLRWHFDPAPALTIVALAAINLTYYEASLELLTEMPFTFGLLVMLLGYEWFRQFNDWRLFAGIGLVVTGLGLMALFRSAALVAVVALVLSLLWQWIRGPERKRAALMLLASSAGLLLLRALDPRLAVPWALNADEQRVFMLVTSRLDYIARSVLGTTHLPKMLDEAIPETLLGVDLDPISGTVLAVLLLPGLIALFRVRPLWGLTACGFIAQVLLFRAALARYFIPIVPLLAIAWWLTASGAYRWLPNRVGKAACGMLLMLWLGCNLVRIGDLAWEQQQEPMLAHYREGRYPLLADFASELRAQVAPHDDPLLLEQEAMHPEFRWLADLPLRSTDQYFKQDQPALEPGRLVYLVTQSRDGIQRTADRLGRRLVGPIITQPYPKGGDWHLYQLLETR